MTASGIEANSVTYRVGLVGYGLAGESFHAPLIAATPGLELASVVTSNAERAESARARYPEVVVLPDVDALLERRDEHQLVVVAAPNRVHAPIALAALKAGLSVVVDKPLAATAADGRRLQEEAEARSLMLAVVHNRRWDGDMLTVRRLIGEGTLGDVLRFESRFERWRPEVRDDAWRERGEPEEAGGVLFDLGSHLIDQALALFGPVESVYAEVERRRPNALVDDDAFLALRHRSGIRSHLWASQVAAQRAPRMRVLGSRAAYVKWGLDVQEAALRAGELPGGGDWGREPPEAWGTLGVDEEARPVQTEAGDWAAFYRGVVASLRDGSPPPVRAAEAVAVLEVIEEGLASVDKG
jgi:scyllo-inositol 2-dehydrogenase (NADP+)